MNPLDPLELSSFNERLLDIMPQHTQNTLKIPDVIYGRLPKDLKEFGTTRMEKTLNKYQSTIEEMEFRGKNMSDFKNYVKRYYLSSIGHDSNSFFKNTILPDLSDIRHIGRQHNNSFISFGKILGSTLTSGDTSANQSGSQNEIMCTLLPTGVLNTYYNQVSVNLQTAAGNIIEGVYDDSAGSPNNLYAQTASLTAATGFGFNSITEFSLDTTAVWSAFNVSSGTTAIYKNSSGTRKFFSTAFAALPSTFTVGGSDSVNFNTKIAHS